MTAFATATCSGAFPPGVLRRDIELLSQGTGHGGAPVWLIHDPLQRRYFQIDDVSRVLLGLWQPGQSAEELARAGSAQLGSVIDVRQAEALLEFVSSAGLLAETKPDAWREYASRATAKHGSMLARVAHNYLFFKIPLLRPQRILTSLLPCVEPLFTRSAACAVALAGMLGIHLASRQWEAFVASFAAAMSWQGAAAFALALIVVKALHELGHAFTAVRYGCRVPSMGVAFMVMAPMLYTDVSDAWRIPSRRERMAIHAAGVIVELALACIATLLWAFLPDGTARQLAFIVATTSWVLSLALNLNPFMRFDGYYLLCELSGIDNLQARAFAIGCWRLRRWLLVPGLAPPEILPRAICNWLTLFAVCTWIYRFVAFTAIAVVVYHYFFKVLGIILFIVEIWYFILRPVMGELVVWRKTIAQGGVSARALATACAFTLACLALVIPWSTTVELPAILEAGDVARIYPPRPAKVVSVAVKVGDFVEKGALIVELEQPEIAHEIETTKVKLELTRLRLARTAAAKADREETLVLGHEVAMLETRLAGLAEQKAQLSVRSPIAGRVLELDRALHPSRWIAKSEMLALVGSGDRASLRGYVTEGAVTRLGDAASGKFIPDVLSMASIPVRLFEIGRAGATTIDIPELAEPHGGWIRVELDGQQAMVPRDGNYMALIEPLVDVPMPGQVLRGVVHLTGKSESILVSSLRQVARVLVRESGF